MAQATAPPAVSIRNVAKSVGKDIHAFRVLDDVSVDIGRREFFSLLGPSGCGKTTLLRLTAGFETADGGSISIEGQDVTAAPPFHRPVNTVFQSYVLFPYLSGEQNVAFALEEQGPARDPIRKRVGESLEMVRMVAARQRRHAGARLSHRLSFRLEYGCGFPPRARLRHPYGRAAGRRVVRRGVVVSG